MLLERRPGCDALQSDASSTVLHRFTGPQADEFAIVCRPEPRSPAIANQVEAAYRALAKQLAAQRSSFRDLTSETLFLRDIHNGLPHVLDTRARVLSTLGQGNLAPLPAFIQQAPVGSNASFELAASAVVPHRRDAWAVRDVRAVPSCACEGCARSGARLVHLGNQLSLRTTNVYGTGGDAFEQVWDMFCVAERLLQQCGMEFRDVARTWIHLRDIDRDYDALNKARREFFRSRGIELRPASTGVQGAPFPDGHDFSVSLQALQSPWALNFTRMSGPSLNEAWSYGADFSRGLRVTEANKVTLYLSGTASLDEAGRSVHVGNFEAQVYRMLENLESLLAQQGAGFGDLVSGITYLKHPGDAPAVRSIFRKRGFGNFPCTIVEAGLCRPELLCEVEAVAMLPLATVGR